MRRLAAVVLALFVAGCVSCRPSAFITKDPELGPATDKLKVDASLNCSYDD